MLELPDDLLDHLALVRGHYLTCFRDAVRLAAQRSGGRAWSEVKPVPNDGERINYRFDIMEEEADGAFRSTLVMHRSFAPRPATTYQLETCELEVDELVWYSVGLILAPRSPDLGYLNEWFERWLDGGFALEEFGGHVHYMSEFEVIDDHVRVIVDFGTAPVEAMRDLIERCSAHGARHLALFSPSDALAGIAPASGEQWPADEISRSATSTLRGSDKWKRGARPRRR